MGMKKELSLEDERKIAERNIRTFNGKVYDSMSDMQIAKDNYRAMKNAKYRKRQVNKHVVLCLAGPFLMILLSATVIGVFLAFAVSVYFGVQALKEKTDKKVIVIIGLVVDFAFLTFPFVFYSY
jgi:hypothetical protein